MSGESNSPDKHDLDLPSDSVREITAAVAPALNPKQIGTNRAICGRVDGPRHGGRTLSGDSAEY